MVQPPPLGTAEEEELKTRPGAIVWAKMTGFPWWPAMLAGVPAAKRKRETDIWCVEGGVHFWGARGAGWEWGWWRASWKAAIWVGWGACGWRR